MEKNMETTIYNSGSEGLSKEVNKGGICPYVAYTGT